MPNSRRQRATGRSGNQYAFDQYPVSRLDRLGFRSPTMGSEVVCRTGNRLTIAQLCDMLREKIKIKRIRVIKIDCFPRLMRQMRQIVVIGIDRQYGYTLRPECFA